MKDGIKGAAAKARARALCGEENGGSEIVQTIIVLGFAVGLGVALLGMQGQLKTKVSDTGKTIVDMFDKSTSGTASPVK